MDREILFRGRTIKTRYFGGEWIEGFFVMSRAGRAEMEPAIITGTEKGCFMTEFVDPATVGQFTGLCDKNGKKIFEGDIVKMVPDDNEEESWITEVKFEDGAFKVEVNGCDYTYTAIGWIDDDVEIEVVGNIHDTPDLEKEEESE
jgi:uncharacterized phage protein (TIGR01671 family)